MDGSALVPVLLLVALAIPVALCVRIVPEAHRCVVFRLGRFCRILGPGLHWVLPRMDDIRRVDLNTALPGWQSLPEPEIHARLQQLAVTGQLPPPAA